MRKSLFLLIATILATSAPTTALCTDVKADTNQDGIVTRTEFNLFVESANLFTQWDLNDNGYLENNEFGILRTKLVNTPGLMHWDLNDDGSLSAYELTTGLYEAFDENRDGYWDVGEWHDAGEAGVLDAWTG